MAVISPCIWYPSGTPGDGEAYDLRFVLTAVRNPDGVTGAVYFRKQARAPIVVGDFDEFCDAWDACLDSLRDEKLDTNMQTEDLFNMQTEDDSFMLTEG